MKPIYKIEESILGDTALYHIYMIINPDKPDSKENRKYKYGFFTDKKKAIAMISKLN